MNFVDGQKYSVVGDVVFESHKVFNNDQTADICADGVELTAVVKSDDLGSSETYQRKLVWTQ